MRPDLAVPLLAGAAWSAPALSTCGSLRRRAWPRLAGASNAHHLALTFDDGPDPASTPHFLDLLRAHHTTATFFLLGEHVVRHGRLVTEMASEGHELAVHGWNHRCTLVTAPGTLTDQLRRTQEAIHAVAGVEVRHYRPPYGVLSTGALAASRRCGLTPTLWTAWGRDWEKGATPQSVISNVRRRARPGGTVLLHDSDRTSAPGSWRTTLAATEVLLDTWAAGGVPVGSLAEHWPWAGCR